MSSSRPRIVFTGSGAVCGAGGSIDDIWDAVRGGRSAIAPIKQWDAGRWPVRSAAEVVEDDRTLVPNRKLHKSIMRTDMFGLYAGDRAIEDSGLAACRDALDEAATARFNDRSGLFVGSGGGNYHSNYDFFPLITEAGGELEHFGREVGNMVSPMWLLRSLPNNVLCHTGINHRFKGTNGCITNHCVSGLQAVVEAAESIRAGEADRMMAVGHEAPLEPEFVFYFHRLGMMLGDSLRPFEGGRQGTIFGEGAAAVVMEKAEDAREREATVLADYLGSGCACEAAGIVEIRPDGSGVSQAIELALADAGVEASEVGMICAHGNGTGLSDASEVLGIRAVFGEKIPPVTGFKWAYGHLIAASGILDLVVAMRALREGIVPGIPTLNRLDPELEPFSVSATTQEPVSDIALVICRGFSGVNVAMLIRAAR